MHLQDLAMEFSHGRGPTICHGELQEGSWPSGVATCELLLKTRLLVAGVYGVFYLAHGIRLETTATSTSSPFSAHQDDPRWSFASPGLPPASDQVVWS